MDYLSRVCMAEGQTSEQSVKNYNSDSRGRCSRSWWPSSSNDAVEDCGSYFGRNEEKTDKHNKMAKASSNKISTILNFAFMLSLLIIITIAESRSIFGIGIGVGTTGLSCESVVGVKSDDTCFGIANTNNLTITSFQAINPNLNCTALFVGQWLCTDGSFN
ncbi:hypothetical protein BUALT_Bualt03G0065200 [Buddleja alternifolia]|uniref:LysM domain-containing protein n=1 Tax=Buddleja alternifolia TaxID=168488 RepID=A0AAV6XRK6_9LAMI|nr:hypothetical protein BUALT_Bualt03G0065200 [Buddleja alternifolia]